MPGDAFDETGRLLIPLRSSGEKRVSEDVVVNAAYCPNGHNLISLHHEVAGQPGIVLRFWGKRSGEGLLALSARLGDSSYELIEGQVDPEEVLQFKCPICGTDLDTLSDCPCTTFATRVMAYLYPRRDPYHAIAFCTVLSCPNSAVIRSGEVIRSESDRQTPWEEPS
ncbi:hypothetical protein JW921_06860 [Candidatus Fermentibacterales bacterium]|nr:hypothetical protein [Candidatus Fermentibacterales bacterium]